MFFYTDFIFCFLFIFMHILSYSSYLLKYRSDSIRLILSMSLKKLNSCTCNLDPLFKRFMRGPPWYIHSPNRPNYGVWFNVGEKGIYLLRVETFHTLKLRPNLKHCPECRHNKIVELESKIWVRTQPVIVVGGLQGSRVCQEVLTENGNETMAW